ncbi:MAG: hypothetical protein R2695_20470 [Acidimicrobiales bacterium]
MDAPEGAYDDLITVVEQGMQDAIRAYSTTPVLSPEERRAAGLPDSGWEREPRSTSAHRSRRPVGGSGISW